MEASRQRGTALTCTICSDSFDSNGDCVVLRGCKHAFHNCVINWLRANPTCPMCRKPAAPESAEKIFFSSVELQQAQDSGSTSVPLSDTSINQLMKAMEIGDQEKTAALEQLRAANSRNAALVRELEKLRAGKPTVAPEVAEQKTQPQFQSPQRQQQSVSPRTGSSSRERSMNRLLSENDELVETLQDVF